MAFRWPQKAHFEVSWALVANCFPDGLKRLILRCSGAQVSWREAGRKFPWAQTWAQDFAFRWSQKAHFEVSWALVANCFPDCLKCLTPRRSGAQASWREAGRKFPWAQAWPRVHRVLYNHCARKRPWPRSRPGPDPGAPPGRLKSLILRCPGISGGKFLPRWSQKTDFEAFCALWWQIVVQMASKGSF